MYVYFDFVCVWGKHITLQKCDTKQLDILSV